LCSITAQTTSKYINGTYTYTCLVDIIDDTDEATVIRYIFLDIHQ
jgi:hypothetical protein